MLSDEELLQQFYVGDNGAFDELWSRYEWRIDVFLRRCVPDGVRDGVAAAVKQVMWQSRSHPECHFDLRRGCTKDTVRGFLLSIAGHIAYRWLIEMKEPGDFF